MAGWIKLWRKLKDNGHLKMPNAAFKLWIFCLLEASPCSNKALGLEAGELWLTYGYISENTGEENKKISKSTISSALRHLEAKGYIQSEVQKFKGIKVRVLNWQEYQGGPEPQGPPCRADSSRAGPGAAGAPKRLPRDMAGTPTDLVRGTPPVPGNIPPGTPTVPASEITGTKNDLPGTLNGPTGTESGFYSTTGVPGTSFDAYGDKPRQPPIRSKNRELRNINTAAADILTRFKKEFGRPLSPIEAYRIADWQERASPEMILEALARAVLKDKRNIAYISGILFDWQKSGIDTLAKAIEQDEKHRRRNKRPPGPGEQEMEQDETSPRMDKKKKQELIKSLYRN